MKQELISVIIPVYNVAPYLKECLDSVVQQTYTTLEIILIDDGSGDGSGEICDCYASGDSRIHVIHQKNRGLSFARNEGLELCTGTYLTFVDSDDFLARDMIATLYRLAKEQKAELVIGGYLLRDSNSHKTIFPLRQYHDKIYHDRKQFLWDFFTRPVNPGIWGCLFHCKLFEQLRFEDVYSEDALMWVPLAKHATTFISTSQRGYFYRKHQGSVTDRRKFNPRLLEIVYVWDKIRQDLAGFGKKFQELADGNFYYYTMVMLLNAFIFAGVECEYVAEIQKIRQRIKDNLYSILVNNNITLKSKMACVLALLSMRLYKIICCNFVRSY